MKKILIIEDEQAYLKLLNTQLTEKGYKVIEAADGKKGLEKAKSEKPDLILLDIRMPIMDGITMLSEMRKNDWGKSVKVIILTNLEPGDKILSGVLTDKPELYLVKSDIQLSELISKIEIALKT